MSDNIPLITYSTDISSLHKGRPVVAKLKYDYESGDVVSGTVRFTKGMFSSLIHESRHTHAKIRE